MPAYTGSVPGDNPVPGKGKTSSLKELQEQVISIKTAPKDAKVDQATVGKNGEILVPRGAGASGSPISGGIAGDPREAETIAPREPEESAPKAAEDSASKETEEGEEAKTARDKRGSKRKENTADSTGASGSRKSGEGSGALGSGEGVALGGLSSNLPGNAGGILGGGAVSGSQRTTVPVITTTGDTTALTTTSDSSGRPRGKLDGNHYPCQSGPGPPGLPGPVGE